MEVLPELESPFSTITFDVTVRSVVAPPAWLILLSSSAGANPAFRKWIGARLPLLPWDGRMVGFGVQQR